MSKTSHDDWVRKVRNDSEAGRKRRKQRLKQIFGEKYNKVKQYEFPPVEEINMERHFYFPKMIGRLPLSTAALAIYPVLCAQADFEEDKEFHLSRESIAIMAGVTPMWADKAVKELAGHNLLNNVPLLSRRMINDGSRRFYIYRMGFVRKPFMDKFKGQYFPFYRCLIDSGVWADLMPRAKALYLTLRQQAQFDFYLYCDAEGLEIAEPVEFDWHSEGYRERKWEVVANQTLNQLCQLADIESSNIQPVLGQLEKHRLINRLDNYFMVYLKPKIIGTVEPLV